jgi:hypothetical protein
MKKVGLYYFSAFSSSIFVCGFVLSGEGGSGDETEHSLSLTLSIQRRKKINKSRFVFTSTERSSNWNHVTHELRYRHFLNAG